MEFELTLVPEEDDKSVVPPASEYQEIFAVPSTLPPPKVTCGADLNFSPTEYWYAAVRPEIAGDVNTVVDSEAANPPVPLRVPDVPWVYVKVVAFVTVIW